jgi:sulfite exporter TauE/SafE
MLLTDSIFVIMFTSGLLGGFGHCIGMCGPVVAAYSVELKKKSVIPHILYSLGRITTYSILGGIMGLTGSFVSVVRHIEKFQVITLAVTGLAMIVFGLAAGGWLPSLRMKLEGARKVSSWVGKTLRYISEAKTAGVFYPMGLIIGFIPCGLLYTALIAAAGAGVSASSHAEGFFSGMLLLLLFGLGTAPALVLLGQFVAMKGEWLRNRLSKASALLMIFIGIIFVYRSFRA